MNNAKMRKNIIIIGVLCRLIIFTSIYFLQNPGLRIDQFKELRFILTPLTCLYATLFFLYITNYANKVQRPLQQLNNMFVAFGVFFLITIHLIELTVIYNSAVDSEQASPANNYSFFKTISFIESALSIFTAVYLFKLLQPPKRN